MKYLLETESDCEIFPTYEEAEIRCYRLLIHPEEIVEITDEEVEDILG